MWRALAEIERDATSRTEIAWFHEESLHAVSLEVYVPNETMGNRRTLSAYRI